MRRLAKFLTEHRALAVFFLTVGLATPTVAFAERLVDPTEATDTTATDPNDVAPPAPTDEVRGAGCTSVCLSSGEDPYRCEEDCVFVTDEKSAVACEGQGA